MDEALKVVKRWEKNPEKNNHLFLAIEGDKICAIDNTDGNCWAEDFKTIGEAVRWLLELE